jgi:hypothetical protein
MHCSPQGPLCLVNSPLSRRGTSEPHSGHSFRRIRGVVGCSSNSSSMTVVTLRGRGGGFFGGIHLVHVLVSAVVMNPHQFPLSAPADLETLLALGESAEEAGQLFVVVELEIEPQVCRSSTHYPSSLVSEGGRWVHQPRPRSPWNQCNIGSSSRTYPGYSISFRSCST